MKTKTNPAPLQNDAQAQPSDPQPGKRLSPAKRATVHLLKEHNSGRSNCFHELPKTLPAPNPVKAPLLSLTPEELAALDRAAQRVEELNRHVMKEISDLHVDILECVDLRRMPFSSWRVLSDYIFFSLSRAVDLPSGCLEREKNPALAMKMLAGALDER